MLKIRGGTLEDDVVIVATPTSSAVRISVMFALDGAFAEYWRISSEISSTLELLQIVHHAGSVRAEELHCSSIDEK